MNILNQKENNSLNLFILFFIIYLIVSIFIQCIQLYFSGIPNVFNDEKAFFGLMYGYVEYKELPEFVDKRILIGFSVESQKAYYQLLALFGYFLDKIGLNIFFMGKLISIIFGALSVVYIYFLFKEFIKEEDESFYYKGSILFGLLPFMLLYSSVLLRDIIVLFFTVYSVFHIIKLTQGEIKSLFKVLITIIITYSLRSSNGIFLCCILVGLFLIIKREWLFLIFERIKRVNVKTKILLAFLILILGIGIYFFIFIPIEEHFLSYQNAYVRRLIQNPAPEDSLMVKFSSYPIYITGLLKVAVSQIIPFPFWKYIESQPARVIESLNGFIWLFIMLSTFFTIFSKKLRKYISVELVFLYLVALLYIVLTANIQINLRRMIAMYPFIFIISYIGFMKMPLNYKKILFAINIVLLLSVYIIYMIIKY